MTWRQRRERLKMARAIEDCSLWAQFLRTRGMTDAANEKTKEMQEMIGNLADLSDPEHLPAPHEVKPGFWLAPGKSFE